MGACCILGRLQGRKYFISNTVRQLTAFAHCYRKMDGEQFRKCRHIQEQENLTTSLNYSNLPIQDYHI